MQVPPTTPPVIPGVQPQETIARALPHIQAQASSPMVQRAVDPAQKTERGNKSRSNAERGKSGHSPKDSRGGSVNIRV